MDAFMLQARQNASPPCFEMQVSKILARRAKFTRVSESTIDAFGV